MKRKMRKLTDNNGSASIEMVIIFPMIMFIIFIFMYATLFLYQTAHAQGVANKAAQHGSNAWNLERRDMLIGKVYPSDFEESNPYGKLLTIDNSKRINKVKEYAKNMMIQYNVLSKNSDGKSYSKSDILVDVKMHNYIVTKKLEVTVKQPTKLPIGGILRLFGIKSDIFYAKGYAEATINDPAEFVRNTDFVVDIVEDTKMGSNVIDKINTYKDKFYDFCEKLGFDFTGGAPVNMESDPTGSESTAISLTGEDEELKSVVNKIKPVDGYQDMVIHSDGDKFKVLHNGEWVSLTHRDVANLIKSKTGNKKTPIRLIACESGSEQSELAQNLSNKLGVEILAPTDSLWIHENGELTIGNDKDSNDGEWKTFTPAKKKN